MAIYQTFDDYDEKIFNYALTIFSETKLLYVNEDKAVTLHENFTDIIQESREALFISKFWILFSIAFESLVKAVLIRHNIEEVFVKSKEFPESIRRRSKSNLISPGSIIRVTGSSVVRFYWEKNDLVIVEDYFRKGTQIIFKHEGWIKNQFIKNDFNFIKQIQTCTLGQTPKFIKDLMKELEYSEEESNNLAFAITHLTKLRRNRDLHCYSGEQRFIETINGQNDLMDLYLPDVNKLILLFKLK